MRITKRIFKLAVASATALALSMLSGCADYGIEIDAPILNKVGLISPKAKPLDHKERAPLIMPPSSQLPVPGAVAKAPQDMNWPEDPDEKAAMIAKLKQQQQDAKDKKRGPWNKALNDMLGNSDTPDGQNAQKETSGIALPGESSGSEPVVDQEQRVQDMMR